MVRIICFLFVVFSLSFSVVGQGSETIIPKEAVVVFSINNTDLLDKISLDQMIQYEFMEEIQSELFHSEGTTLKESGIDFKQRLNFFNGKTTRFEVSGITIGIENKNQILKVFNNFEKITSHIQNVEIFRNDLNYLFISGAKMLIVRVEPNLEIIKSIADSIWFERSYSQYFNPNYDIYDDGYDSEMDIQNEEIANLPGTNLYSDSVNSDYETMYWDMRDSIRYGLQQLYIRQMSTDLFINHNSLYSSEVRFQQQLEKQADAIFFFDNARNLDENKGIWQFKSIFPVLYNNDKGIYDGNLIVGELNLVKNSIKVNLEASYGDKLGKIYNDLTDAKFVKSFQKYIYRDALGYFTYNVNLKKSFHTSYDVVMDMLQGADDKPTLTKVLMGEIINEFVNIDNVFDTYQGSMFGSVNGYLTINTSYVDYKYDEETFNYTEITVDTVRDIPNFTIGFKTDNPSFLKRVAKVIAKTFPENTINHGNYYEVKDAILNTIPGYFAIVDDLLLFSVDENLFTTHLNGYAKDERIDIKKAKRSKLTYLYLDIDKTIAKLPRESLTARQNEIIGTMINRSGVLELKTLSTNKEETKFELNLKFNNSNEDSAIHLLDLINSLYILSRK